MRRPEFFLGLLVAAVAGSRGAALEPPVAHAVGEASDASRFVLRVAPVAPAVAETPDGARITLEGFGTPSRRPGAPELPLGIFRVAIPPGAEPRLAVALEGESLLRGVVPRPQEREVADVLTDPGAEPQARLEAGGQDPEGRPVRVRRVRLADASLYSGRDAYPAAWAWLGATGAFRDQRYVEVYVAPVRWDPASRGVRVAQGLTLTVEFAGAPARSGPPRLDARYEDLYRNAFVNYDQGTLFRLPAAAPAPSTRAASAGASGPLYRIRVRQNGVVRLTVARLNGTGFLTTPISTWKLTNRGVEVPLLVHDVNANDTLDGSDWVEFYGQALDDEPKTVLNADFPDTTQDIYEARDFSDENVYFLSTEAGGRARLPARDATPTNVRVPPGDFQAVAHQEVDNAWRPLGPNDPWYWSPTLYSNGQPNTQTPNLRTDSVPLPGLASGTSPAEVRVKIRGITEDANTFPDHHSRVILKSSGGQTLATNDDDGTFDGRTIYLHDFTWTYPGSGATLTDPAQIELDALPVTGLASQQFILDWIEVVYRRAFAASGDALTIDYPDGDTEFQVSGIASSTPEVWEITGRVGSSDVVAPVRLTGSTVSGTGPYTVRFRVDNDPALPDGTNRRFVVAGDGAVTVPADPDFTADTVSDLKSTSNQADLVVIASPDVLGPSGSAARTALNNLLSYHASKGITSKIAMLEDVQDEFNDGLAGPLAIKRFLTWVMSTNPGEGWAAPKPRYVLLLGDGSYDYKGGEASGNYVPTQICFLDDPSLGYYASDNLMAAVVGGDNLADLVVGRISARDPTTLANDLTKILNYQQSPPSGNWRRHALVVSDRGKLDSQGQVNVGESLDFEQTNDEAISYMKIPPHTDRRIRYYTDYYAVGKTPAQCKADIKAAVNGTDGISDGAGIMQFEGHGNFDLWSDDSIFLKTDVDTLTNSGKTPWLIAHDCLTGGFHTTNARSLGEDWINQNATGGAVAVFSPSGLSFQFVGRAVTETLWNDLFGPQKERTIDLPVLDALSTLCGQGSIEPCESYVLLGDPATDLVFPSVGPPTGVAAAGGNAVVNLSWTASTTAGATYDVYRTFNLVNQPYVKVNASPVTGTAYADTSAVNATTYYYYVVALDSQGFESRWSNFNSDCAVDGPDCVTATPLNPNPPSAPTGVVVSDPETGGKLNVSWNPNPETDLKYYEVSWGTQSGAYTNTLNTGKATTTALTGLTNGVTYYVAVRATNTSSHTSAYSQEATGVPTFVRGVKSPQFITSLHVDKSGSDALLTWSAVTTDIYGKPTTIAHYDVYRGTSPGFVPGPGNRIGSPTGTSWTDAGALGGGTPSYYYLVGAVDTSGNPGGLGRQLPNGIDTMTAAKGTTPGDVVLTWPAISTDFDGRPSAIDHYEIYAQATPFSRASIRDGLVPLLQSTTATSVTITPPASSQYYSVIVVDTKGNKSPF